MKLFRLFFLLLPIFLASCGSQRGIGERTLHSEEPPSILQTKEEIVEEEESELAFEETSESLTSEEALISKIAEYAKQYLGTGYKYGGTTTAGMDCSGLVYTAFSKEDIPLPRTSRDMAQLGKKLDLAEVVTGDLLFFQTNRKKKVINHVGLVVDIAEQGIFFIHSTISRGVIISSLAEKYWQDHFVMARRIQ